MPLDDILPTGEVHLYLADDPVIVSPQLLAAYEAMLSDNEATRRNRFRFDRQRHQFLVARALLRKTLSFYRPDVHPAAWRFGTNAYGRPHVVGAGAGEIDFNLSHTDGRIALAVCRNLSPGVDIEWLGRPGHFTEIAGQFLATAEVKELSALLQATQKRRFFDLWTLKEAYIKARGMGLSISLQDFAIEFQAGDKLSICFDEGLEDDASRWQLWSIFAGEDYALSVALANAGHTRVRLFQSIPLLEVREIDCRILAET